MNQRKDVAEAELPMREELAQLRTDIDHLIGTVGRLANGVAGSAIDGAKRTATYAGTRAEEAYDAVLAQGGRALKSTDKTIKAHPYLSIAIASGIGLLVGRLLSQRPSRPRGDPS
jgi:ElaB/YqjD/DUF883 family membrane-anchored ribosome-binding protein